MPSSNTRVHLADLHIKLIVEKIKIYKPVVKLPFFFFKEVLVKVWGLLATIVSIGKERFGRGKTPENSFLMARHRPTRCRFNYIFHSIITGDISDDAHPGGFQPPRKSWIRGTQAISLESFSFPLPIFPSSRSIYHSFSSINFTIFFYAYFRSLPPPPPRIDIENNVGH